MCSVRQPCCRPAMCRDPTILKTSLLGRVDPFAKTSPNNRVFCPKRMGGADLKRTERIAL